MAPTTSGLSSVPDVNKVSSSRCEWPTILKPISFIFIIKNSIKNIGVWQKKLRHLEMALVFLGAITADGV